MKILLLEDDVILNELIEEYLISLNYEVICEYDGLEAIDKIYNEHFDILLLDVGVPSLSGFELLKTIRDANIHVPSIFITSLHTTDDLEKGFDIGCDDYIKKPFELKELNIRINHIKKINNIESKNILIINENISYDYSNIMIKNGQEEYVLSKKEAKIFEFFLKNRMRLITFDEIISNIWQFDETPSNATLRTYIKNLRKYVPENTIITLKGLGYRFES